MWKRKYGNVKIDGCDSKKEAKRKAELQLLERAGVISDLRCQVTYELLPRQEYKGKLAEHPVRYIADFVYEENGETVVEDTKGFRTPEYIIKRKLMLWVHGIKIKET